MSQSVDKVVSGLIERLRSGVPIENRTGNVALAGLFAADEFSAWFARSYGYEVPEAFARFISRNPTGISGPCGKFWAPCEIVNVTEECDVIGRGICIIGAATTFRLFMLRASDGKVYLVDGTNYTSVEATFADMAVCLDILALDH